MNQSKCRNWKFAFVNALSAVLLSLSFGANAAVTSRDLVAGSNDGLLTFDDATNIEWLDVTQTLNRSYNQVLGQLGAGGQFAGFQVASTALVRQLFIDGGWSDAFNTNYFDAIHHAQSVSIVSLIGRTTVNYPGNFSTYGMVSDRDSFGRQYYDMMYSFQGGDTIYGAAYLNAFSEQVDVASDYIGTYLYRATAPVPEPETWAMLLAGLGLLGFAARRRRQKTA
jgi:hypothetical protein